MNHRKNSRRNNSISVRKTRRNIHYEGGAVNHNVANIVQGFFNMLMHIRLYHWSTTSYARHTSSGALYDTLSLLIDQFVETYMGRYKRPEFEKNTFNVQVKQCNDHSIIETLGEYCHFLEDEVPKYVNKSDSDLLNIRDEILAEINKTLYLYTLN